MGKIVVYNTVVLGGLLHDVDKFLHLDSVELIKSFVHELDKICNVELLETLVIGELQDRENVYCHLLNRADVYSSSEESESQEKFYDHEARPLDSVFNRVEIGKGKNKEIYQYSAQKYSPENGFPVLLKKQKKENIDILLRNFRDEFQQIAQNISDFATFYNQLYSLLLKYTWCIPSNSQSEIADISLFDHAKTTSAIVACLYQYHEASNSFSIQEISNDKTNKFLILVGDISGIQSYIFSGSHIGAGAVAKRLRARSFYLNMLSELASQKIRKSFNLPISNILMASGGKFYILLPNTLYVKNKLEEIKKNISIYLLEEFQGELALNLAVEELSGLEFGNFGKVIRRVGQKLALKKKMPFFEVITNKGYWQEDLFLFEIDDEDKLSLCQGCGKEFAQESIDGRKYGVKCLKDLEVGQILPKTKYLEFTSQEKCHIPFLKDNGVNLKTEIPPAPNTNLTFVLNGTEIIAKQNLVAKYLANYVPTDEKRQAISFDYLVEKSKGIKRLAYLKADVDNLGSIFAFGFMDDENGKVTRYDTISRVTTFSRMLDLFFSGRVNQIISRDFQDCYIVYSGGDDLLIIGPWDKIIDLSIVINKEFQKFVGFNPNLTLSAGISIVKTKTPVSKAVDEAEELLELSKDKVLKGKKSGRNQVTVFNRTMSWDDFALVINEAKKLTQWVEKKYLTRMDLWKLKKYDRLFQDFHQHNNVEGLKYQGLLAYDLGRKKKENKISSEILQWHESLLELNNPVLINLGCIIDYTLCACRGGEENEQ